MPHDEYVLICPYYHKLMDNNLFCCGIPATDAPRCEAFYKQCFADRKSRNAWLQNYCASFGYQGCRYAQLNQYLFDRDSFPRLS